MWIAIGVGIPIVLLSLWIAVWPGLSQSHRDHEEHIRSHRHGRVLGDRRTGTRCAMCAAQFEAPTELEAIATKNAHVLRLHAQSGDEARPATAVTPV